MKDSTRRSDKPIVDLIRERRYTAKEIALMIPGVTVLHVYNVAYRHDLSLRTGVDRRRAPRGGRRASDLAG
ncbi:MAG TPA: hypothetical protein VFN81_08670 [Sphingomicrobium sp.]|nr:hypothetical protein [Sphingomicrobium sp.]